MPKDQLALFDAPPVGPSGFRYAPDFVSEAEAETLTRHLEELPFAPFQFRGFEGRRRTCSFGMRYDFNGPGLVEAEPIPDWLAPLRARTETLAGLLDGAFANVLINEYRVGAPIGWHRDRPHFEKVVGVSLGAATTMRFRRRDGERFERMNALLAPRSAYLLDGEARRDWEHSIPEAQAHRYSITFRNLARNLRD